MSGHAATAVRRNGPGAVWFAVCPSRCVLPGVASKEQAEWAAKEHRIRAALSKLRCDCFDPDEMEFYGNHPCPKCEIAEALGGAA